MIKLLFLTCRRAGRDIAEYDDYWTTKWRNFAASLPGLRGYRQCIGARLAQAPFGAASKFDGLDELWFDDIEAARSVRSMLSSIFEADQVSPDMSLRMAVREHVIIPGFAMRPGQDVKLTYFWRHRPDLTAEEARDHWYTRHAPLVPGTPGVIRHVQGHPLATQYEDQGSWWTGISELWFRSLDVLPQFIAAPQMVEQGVDGALFSDFKSVENYVTVREEVIR